MESVEEPESHIRPAMKSEDEAGNVAQDGAEEAEEFEDEEEQYEGGEEGANNAYRFVNFFSRESK